MNWVSKPLCDIFYSLTNFSASWKDINFVFFSLPVWLFLHWHIIMIYVEREKKVLSLCLSTKRNCQNVRKSDFSFGFFPFKKVLSKKTFFFISKEIEENWRQNFSENVVLLLFKLLILAWWKWIERIKILDRIS